MRIVPRTLAILLALAFVGTPRLSAQPRTAEVTVANPARKDVAQWEEYIGRFEAVRHVEVRARVSGQLMKIHFTDGQMVRAGDVLFSIDLRPFEIAVDAARADVARVQAQIAVTSKDLERAQQLSAKDLTSRRELDQRRADSDVARAQLQSAEAALRTAELNLDWASVRAPIDGRTSDRKVDAGNLVSGGQVGATLLATIVSLDPIRIVFDVPQPDYERNTRSTHVESAPSNLSNDLVQVRLAEETEWTRTGKVDFVDNQFSSKAGTIRLRAALDNKDLSLTPGMFGRLRLYGGTTEALLIPDAAVVSDQNRKVVYVVDGDNKVQTKPVTLGSIERALRAVTAGLTRDDRVVISGLANPAVRPGATVAPVAGSITLAKE